MKLLLILFAVLAYVEAAAVPVEKCTPEQYTKYLAFKEKFKRPRFSQEVEDRKCLIWSANKLAVKLNNANPFTHDSAINHLSALTPKEFKRMLGLKLRAAPSPTTKPPKTTTLKTTKTPKTTALKTTKTPKTTTLKTTKTPKTTTLKTTTPKKTSTLKITTPKITTTPETTTTLEPTTQTVLKSLPDSIDWREFGLVSDVKDQGGCGSCWSFSAIGALEGQLFKKTRVMTLLSEQDVLDCTYPGDNGCDGGTMDDAFEAAMKLGGIFKNESYPYTSGSGLEPFHSGTCKFDKTQTAKIGVKVEGFVHLPEGDELALKTAVATMGPIAVGLDASGFSTYKNGVFTDPNCASQGINHAVLIVGYGTNTTSNIDYWIVKNTWSAKWGDNGYINIPRNVTKENSALMTDCGITSFASYVRVA